MHLAQLGQGLRAGVDLLLLGLYAWQFTLLRQLSPGQRLRPGQGQTVDAWVEGLSVLRILALLLSLLALMLWLHRAYQNAHRLPGARPQHGTSAAIWGWLLPIVNFWMPYRVMGEVGRYIGRFEPGPDGRAATRWDALHGGWWVLYLGGLLFSRVILYQPAAVGLPDLERTARLLMGSQMVSLLSALVTLALLRTIAPRERALLAAPPTPMIPAGA